MNFRWDKKYLYWGITAFFVICASICFYYLLFHSNNLWKGISTVINIAMPIIDGFVLAYILSPVEAAQNQYSSYITYCRDCVILFFLYFNSSTC